MDKTHEYIKAIRLSKGLTQDVIAEKLGMTQSNYARIESGKAQITVDKLNQLSELFEMSVSSILNYEGSTDIEKDSHYYLLIIAKLEKKVLLLEKKVKDFEEEIESDYEYRTNQKNGLTEQIQNLKDKLKDKEKERLGLVADKDRTIEEKDRVIKDRETMIEDKNKMINLLNRTIDILERQTKP
jgi:transcriptional regulator with XRE-family HTH domain